MTRFLKPNVMKQLFFQSVAMVLFSGVMLAQPDPNTQPAPLFENFGIIDTSQPSPQIDALAFANYGTFTVTTSPSLTDFPYTQFGLPQAFTIIPYDFQNTLNFTNTGSMTSFSGFRFDTAFADRPRQPALNFVNAFGGTVFGTTYLLVASTNVVNQGILTAAGDGFIQLKGQTVNLSRSGLQIQRLGLDQGCSFGFPLSTTNFFPAIGIFDLFADLHTNGLDVTTLIAVNPDFTVSVTAPFPVGNLPRAKPFIRFSQTSPTNLFYQAVFVQVRDTNVTPTVRFADFPRPPQGNNPPFRSPIVRMSATASNVVTGNLEVQAIYLWDRLASEKVINAETNLVFLTNVVAGTLLPSPYYLSRVAPCEYFTAAGVNYTLTNNIFYDSSYSNNIVTNVGAAYVASVSSTGTQLAAIPSGTLTNITSRIEIEADTLDLNLARFQAAGVVMIKAKNLVTSSNSVVQAANLAYDLGSPLGNLLVKDLSLPTVPTFEGNVAVWSGYWTNQTGIVGTNAMMPTIPDPADPAGTNMIANLETNVIEIVFHAMFVDNRMFTETGVTVYDLAMRGADVLFDDDMTVNHALTIDAERFTISEAGILTLTGAGYDSLTPTNAPSLSYFTNLGTLQIPNHADFGTSSRPLASFVNAGTITAFTEAFTVDQFENSGSITASGVLSVDAKAGKLEGGRISAGSIIRLIGSDFKMRNHNQSSAGLFIGVTNSLTDSGKDARSSLVTSAGFHLAVKPSSGDLLGTTFRSTAPKFAAVSHTWAADDLGATSAGYSNNVAIGRLELDAAQFGKLTFSGVGAKNGLYVDLLQIGPGLTNGLANNIQIDPNLTIYFADSNLPVEDLDGKFDGHLRWVREFAGPNTTVDVIFCTNGVATTVKMNRSLRNSLSVDSDGDGTANKFDPFPLNADALCQDVPNLPAGARITSVTLISQSPVSALLSLEVSPKQVYQVEYTTDLLSPTWQVFSTFTNAATSGNYKFQLKEALPAGESQRFYRVRVNP
jgi:hypothetical protein